jgi:hypothetical protein
MNNELEYWKNNIINKYDNNDDIIFSCFSYWYLEEVSCVPIYRNQEWFNKSKIELELFWNKVLKYRELGLDKLIYDINQEKEEKKNIKLELKNITKKTKEPKETKESTSKRQKKIKEFIILDDNKMVIEDISTISSDDEFITNSKISMFTEISEDNSNEFITTEINDDDSNYFVTNSNISMFT